MSYPIWVNISRFALAVHSSNISANVPVKVQCQSDSSVPVEPPGDEHHMTSNDPQIDLHGTTEPDSRTFVPPTTTLHPSSTEEQAKSSSTEPGSSIGNTHQLLLRKNNIPWLIVNGKHLV